MKNNIYTYIALCSLGFVACEPEFDQPLEENPITQTSGTADFSKYIALGNSLTAGFADGALYSSGQEVGFVNLIATSMKSAGGGEFNIPLMSDDVGGFAGFEAGFGTRLVIQTDAQGNQGPARLNNNVASNDITARAEGSNFNNLGVPGITSFQFGFEGLGNPAGLQTTPISANPYFVRFASSPNTSILADAISQQPTFFSLWLGNNDVLGYATSGGVGVDQTGNPNAATYGSNDITDPGLFNTLLNTYVGALTQNGASGLLVNIPNITDIPFFTTVPNNALVLNETQAAGLTGFFQLYANIVSGGIQLAGIPQAQADAIASQYAITFNPGPNRFLIRTAVTQTNPQGFRQMTEEELLLLTINQGALANEGYGSALITPEIAQILGEIAVGGPSAFDPANAPIILSAINPIEDLDALDNEELSAISNALTSYNQTLEAIADANPNIALYDANADLARLSSEGITSEGSTITATFVTGGAFSLDGVHLSPRGNAVIANRMMETINRNFGSSLQLVSPNFFPFVPIP